MVSMPVSAAQGADGVDAGECRRHRPLPRHVGAQAQGAEQIQGVMIIGDTAAFATEHRPTDPIAAGAMDFRQAAKRSEEHTSELQSLMRNSYAVFCLKKKKNTQHYYHLYTEYIVTY